MARMSLSAVVLCRQRLRPPPSMEQSEGSGCADSPPSSHVATAVISGLQTLLLFAVASISDHRRHQRTISSAPVPCRLRTAASTMAWHPRSQRNYRMASDDDCETESRPRRHAKFSFRARLRSRRFFVGGNDAALCPGRSAPAGDPASLSRRRSAMSGWFSRLRAGGNHAGIALCAPLRLHKYSLNRLRLNIVAYEQQ